MTPDERVVQLEAENACRLEQIAPLVARVWELEAWLARDSRNSRFMP